MEIKLKRHIGVRAKGFLVSLRSLDLRLEACEQRVLGRGGRWALDTNIFSPQFGYRLVQIRSQAMDGGGGSAAWKLPVWHV